MAETDIHANHAEAFFSSLRRTCATFRRKTNTYAKATTGLQRLLRVYWVVHNFLRVHFTIREVPGCRFGHPREAAICAGNFPDANGISDDFKRQKRSHQTEPVPA